MGLILQNLWLQCKPDYIAAFPKGKKQMTAAEVEETKSIANF